MSALDDFIVRAGLAGVGLALIAAPMGCFVLWRRMAYFGDSVAHAALLGVALALLTEGPMLPAVLLIAVGAGLAVARLTGRLYAADTMLGVVAHGALAVALVVLSLTPGARGGLDAWLFGDILAVSRGELLLIWAGVGVAGGLLWLGWRPLVTATINEELAIAEGVNPERATLTLTLALAIVVAVGLKVVGALLVTAMLILPAAAARPLARSPEAMAVIAAAMGCAAVVGGLRLSWVADTPAGPSIVTVALTLVIVSNGVARLIRAPG